MERRASPDAQKLSAILTALSGDVLVRPLERHVLVLAVLAARALRCTSPMALLTAILADGGAHEDLRARPPRGHRLPLERSGFNATSRVGTSHVLYRRSRVVHSTNVNILFAFCFHTMPHVQREGHVADSKVSEESSQGHDVEDADVDA